MSRIVLTKVYNRTEFYGCVHPLGIMYLASFLRDRRPGKDDLRLHDMILGREPAEVAIPKILDFAPDIVGLSCMTHEASVAHELAKQIKVRAPFTKVIVGGPYTGGNPEKILQNPAIDYVVVGEGEWTFLELVEALERGETNPSIPGVAYMRRNEYVWNCGRDPAEGEMLDSIPFPAWDLVDIEAYYDKPRFASGYAVREYMSMFTSRGCPYHCTYCHEVFGKKFHAHSMERTMAELDAIVERYGVGELCIVDDIFNIDRKRALAISEAIASRGYDLKIDFPNGIRADQMTYELLEAMKRAGTYRLSLAVETATPRLQKFTKKHVNLTKMNEVIGWCDGLDIFSHGFLMLGFPGETREEIETTIDYALKSRLHTANFFAVNPFEGTEMSRQVAEMGIEVNDGATDNFNYFKNNFQLSEVGTADLADVIKDANRRFYMNARRITRIIQVMPYKMELPRFFVLFVIRSLPIFKSHKDGQAWLDFTTAVHTAVNRARARLFPSRHVARRKALAKRLREEREQAAPAAPIG
ncbi:MAG: B12-binding domain-containing radical SAM protein [Myxococcales bacterium]|nr:B12-binding domain-containing radical SAM protein [Myxococcales bacterium]